MDFLIIKTSSLGDIIQTFPVVEYLRKKNPTCAIDWVVEEEYASLVEAHPEIRHVYKIASRRWRRTLFHFRSFQEWTQALSSMKKTVYDAVFDLQGNTKSAVLTGLVKAPKKVGFGWKSAPEWPHYFVTNEKFEVSHELPIQQRYLSIIGQFFKDPLPFEPQGVQLRLSDEESQDLIFYKGLSPSSVSFRVMVAFSSKWDNKCLPLSTLKDFLHQIYLKEDCFFYFTSGNSQEKETANALAKQFPHSYSLPPLSFPLWQRLMREMNLVISVDSAALALCGTTSTPSFGLFGPTHAEVYKPRGEHHHHFQGTCPYQMDFKARCPRLRSCKTGACLKRADAGAIFKRYCSKEGK